MAQARQKTVDRQFPGNTPLSKMIPGGRVRQRLSPALARTTKDELIGLIAGKPTGRATKLTTVDLKTLSEVYRVSAGGGQLDGGINACCCCHTICCCCCCAAAVTQPVA